MLVSVLSGATLLGGAVLSMSLAPGIALAASAPSAPRNVQGLSTDFQAERVTVGWAPPLGDGGTAVTAYRVQASRDEVHWTPSLFSDCYPDPTCVPELTATFRYELTIYQTYVFRVAAYNAAGWGPWSDLSPAYTVLPGDQPRVQSPRELIAVPALRKIRMEWLPPVDDDGVYYVVEWSRNGGAWKGGVRTDEAAYTIRDLKYGTYSLRVRSQRYEVEYSVWADAADVLVPDHRQRVMNFDGLPSSLAAPGTTLIVPCGLVTNAGQRVRVSVRWELSGRSARGSVDAVVVRKRTCGKVKVALSGTPVTVTVMLAAPAVGRYSEVLRMRTYRIG